MQQKQILKNATAIDTSFLAKKVDLAHSKLDLEKLDIDKVKNLPTNFKNLKNKVCKLDLDKLIPVPANLSKLGDVVKNDVVNKYVYKAKFKNI